jgi:hypothetical protein
MLERDYRSPEYEHPIHDINWTSGVGRPAGVYWLDGTIAIAEHESAAEQRLLDRGGVLVATLRFDADPYERVLGNGSLGRVEHVTASRAAHELFVAGVN